MDYVKCAVWWLAALLAAFIAFLVCGFAYMVVGDADGRGEWLFVLVQFGMIGTAITGGLWVTRENARP